MANIKVGDNVITSHGNYCEVAKVIGINPNTIAVAGLYGGGHQPRQHPENWRVAVPEIVDKVKTLFAESDRLRKEANELIGTMTKVEL